MGNSRAGPRIEMAMMGRTGFVVAVACVGIGVVGAGSAVAQFPAGPWPAEASGGELRERPEVSTLPLEGEIDRSTYRLGPGDQLTLWLSGERVEVTTLDITAEGRVLLDPAGPLLVSGMTVDEAEAAVRRALSPYLRNVVIRIQLSSIREFKVHVLGEVDLPATYVTSAVERVAGVITMAGGVTSIGSRRNITVLRRTGEVIPVDLVSYEVLGCLDCNPLLLEGDVVRVPPLAAAVRVLGSVFRPGQIELRPGETIAGILALAGGLEPEASLGNVELERFRETDPSRSERRLLDLGGNNRAGAPDTHLVLRNGDRLYVRAIPKWHEENAVLVLGEVRYPGWYAIEEDRDLLSDVIGRAGGFTALAALREATVMRTERDTVVDQEFLRLKNMPVADMTKTEYEYFKFRSRERHGQMVVDFEKLFLEDDKSHDLVLRNRDEINVPRKPLTVAVEGAIASPGHVIYAPDKDVGYYISQAGGYAWNANRGKARVIKVSSGEWKWPEDVKVLEPGDTIWVPEKREIEWWPLFKDLTRVMAELATVYLVVDRALAD